MKSLFSLLSLATLTLSTPVPSALAPSAFKIKNIVHGGSGCPQGSIKIEHSDSTIFPIYFSRDYSTAIGPDVSVDQNRKNCQINLDLTYSSGWSFAVYSADFTGFADIGSGVKATVKSTYYFSGQQDQATSTSIINGPFEGKYTKHDEIAISAWSPCSGSALFNVNAEVALTASSYGASGSVVAIKESGRFANSLYLKWKQC